MKKFVYGGVLGLVFANMFVWPYVLQGGDLRVTFFDVGQGDAIFVETPQGHQMLIDGGPNNRVVEKVGQELPFWDKSLDLVILTHPDADHITGLVDVLQQYNVQNVLWTGIPKDTNIFAEWEKALLAEDASMYIASADDIIVWSQDPLAFMEIISPTQNVIAAAKEINDTSVVLKLAYGTNSFLFTGDISDVAEGALVEEGSNVQAQILKVPHHGSKSSSSARFLAAVQPEIGVIEVAKNNRYGHPAQEVLSRFSDFGIPILRTDQIGDIILQSNGNSITHTSR
jgi:competence protein ComEC